MQLHPGITQNHVEINANDYSASTLMAVFFELFPLGLEPFDALLPCPFCGTHQIQRVPNYSNRSHDLARCRDCKAEAKVTVWNTRTEPNITYL